MRCTFAALCMFWVRGLWKPPLHRRRDETVHRRMKHPLHRRREWKCIIPTPSYSGRSVLVYLRWANVELAPGDYPNADTGRYCTRKIEEFMQHLDEGVLPGIPAARDDYDVGGRYQLLWGNTCSMTATITSCRTSASRRTPSSPYVTCQIPSMAMTEHSCGGAQNLPSSFNLTSATKTMRY